MNKFIIALFLFAYISSNDYTSTSLDFANTEPYYNFDWLDEDSYSITMNFQSSATVAADTCCLYNGTVLCSTSCTANSKALTCEFKGEDCKADSDNPATKFYHSVLCGVCTSASTAAAAITASGGNPFITVSVAGENYIKYSMILLLSLLAL